MNMRRSLSALALGTPSIMRLAVLCLFASAVLTPLGWTQAPVFAITPQTSTIKFSVSSSISSGVPLVKCTGYPKAKRVSGPPLVFNK